MAKSKFAEIERDKNRPMVEILTDLYARFDGHSNVQDRVAEELGVTQGTVSLWLLRCGLRQSIRLVRQQEQVQS